MSLTNKKDAILKLFMENKSPEEIQDVINILFAEDGFLTIKVN